MDGDDFEVKGGQRGRAKPSVRREQMTSGESLVVSLVATAPGPPGRGRCQTVPRWSALPRPPPPPSSPRRILPTSPGAHEALLLRLQRSETFFVARDRARTWLQTPFALVSTSPTPEGCRRYEVQHTPVRALRSKSRRRRPLHRRSARDAPTPSRSSQATLAASSLSQKRLFPIRASRRVNRNVRVSMLHCARHPHE